MSQTIQPYLFFRGRCEEAIDFYKSALGAKVEMLIRHKDSPEPPAPGFLPEGYEDKVMHASFQIGNSIIMGSDGCGKEGTFSGFSLSLNLATEAEVDKVFAALSEDGKVNMPLSKTFWSPKFGMVEDRFGIGWMVAVAPEGQPS